MKKDIALKRYLERHIEPGLPNAPMKIGPWKNVLVIPTYNESPELLSALSQLPADDKALVIIVLNRPDSDTDSQANSALRSAINELDNIDENLDSQCSIYHLNNAVDLFCYDLEKLQGPTPAAQGVGLARKTGCDIALLWQSQGAISGQWICSTDADALLPVDYFSRLEEIDNYSSAVYPFSHTPGSSQRVNQATALYEIRLHQYVLGLSYAQSPYAYHTLGSCIAVKGQQYAKVRGYPKRSGGEDFYLLNKLAKLGPIARLSGECIALQSRASLRVPFGTGPAVRKIMEDDNDSPIFYHPQIFECLRVLLLAMKKVRQQPLNELPYLLLAAGLGKELAHATIEIVMAMGLAKALEHCRKHGKSEEQFLRHFHQWFDGFRTLKFIHGLRDVAWPMQCLPGLFNLQPTLFPAGIDASMDVEAVRTAIRVQWQWSVGAQNNNKKTTEPDSSICC